jgi:4-amino-4-deoxy-L-arabinose transferase-like glycosyltransferase
MQKTQHTAPQWTWWLDIILLTALGMVLYHFYLSHYPLIPPDEARYPEVAREMLKNGNFITPMVNGIPFLDKPPLFYWLEALFIKIFGVNELGIRFWPTLAGTLGGLANYASLRLLVTRRAALMSATILLTSLFYFAMAHYGNLDLTVALWISCCLYCFILSQAPKFAKQRSLLLYLAYFFIALGILTKGLIGLVLPGAVALLYLLCRRDWAQFKTLKLPTGLLLILAICTPWFVLVGRENPGFWHYYFVVQQFERYLTANFNGHHPIWFYPATILLGLLPWSWHLIASPWKNSRHQKTNFQPQSLLWLWAGLILIFFSIPDSKIVGYILPVFPPLAALIALAFEQHWQTSNRRFKLARFATAATTALLAGGLLFALSKLTNSPYHSLKPLLWLAISVLLGSFILQLMSLVGQRLTAYFAALSLSAIALNLTVMIGISQYQTTLAIRSTYPLTQLLLQEYQAGDRVLCFDSYYHDLPIYLQHSVTLVYNFHNPEIEKWDTWAREFSLGLKQPRYQKQVWSNRKLAESWAGTQRLFVYLDSSRLAEFKHLVQAPVYPIAQHQAVSLISNKPKAINSGETIAP